MPTFQFDFEESRIDKNPKEQLIDALEGLIQSVYVTSEDYDYEARSHGLMGLVEVFENGEHSFNGLLLTHNGYFLAIKDSVVGLSNAKVRPSDGKLYDFEKICFTSTIDNIALVKANIPGECTPIRYILPQSGYLKKDTILLLAQKRNGYTRLTPGFVEDPNNDSNPMARYGGNLMFPHHFTLRFLDKNSKEAGGIIMTPEGQIIGLSCWNRIKEDTHEYLGCTGVVKMFHILEKIYAYKEQLKQI